MHRRHFVAGASAALSLAATRLSRARTPSGEAWARAADIARKVRAPTFADRVFDITQFGAKADGTSLSTAAIASAIAACARAGGGRVLVPAGTFLTGAIHLKSHVELHVS